MMEKEETLREGETSEETMENTQCESRSVGSLRGRSSKETREGR